jgi:replicative DNA helicase
VIKDEEKWPSDTAAEEAVIASCMADALAANTAFDSIKPEAFYDPRNSALFRVLASLYPRHPDLDPIIVRDFVKETGQEQAIGGLERIGACIEKFPSPGQVEAYCSVVNKKYQRRKLLMAAYEIASLAREAPEGELTALALDKIECAVDLERMDQPVSIQDAAAPVIEDALNNPSREYWGIPCRLAGGAIDDLTGGIQRQQLWVLGASPSMGKTTLINAICRGVAQAGEGEPLIVGTENTPTSMARTAIAAAAGIHTKALRKRDLTAHQREAVVRVRDDAQLGGYRAIYAAGRSVNEVHAIARAHRRRYGLPLLVIDMVTGLGSPGKDAKEKVDAALLALNAMKVALDCCIICCAHLNRQVHTNEGRRPSLANLRDSGEWEQRADRVLFLHREKYYSPTNPGPDVTEIIQAKDREDGGGGSSCFVEWKKATGRYERSEKTCSEQPQLPSWS